MLAMLSMLTVLPALLAITGRNAFWSPFDTIPHAGEAGVDEQHGFWRRVGNRVASRPRAVWVTGTLVLLVMAANVLALDANQTQDNQFRGEVDSVTGQEILTRNFAAGASAPTDIVVPDRATSSGSRRPRASSARSAPAPRRSGHRAQRHVPERAVLEGSAGHDPEVARGGR